MRAMLRVLVVALIALVAGPWPVAAQTAVAAPSAVAAETAVSAVIAPAAPSLSPAEMEKFLLEGKVVKNVRTLKGVTDARQVTMSNGVITHDAQIQIVDIAKPFFDVGPKHTEVNFRDCYCYNIAAYRLAVLLGLDNVPMSVKRDVQGKPAAVTWWLEDVMDEGDRRKNKVEHSNSTRAAEYYAVMYVFDELIQNRDRNAGNIMWGRDSKMWMIDHTRAFRTGKDLLNPDNLSRIERSLFEKLRALDRSAFTDAVKSVLTKDEIEALFIRREKIVRRFDERIASLGEARVLYTIR
jgi:hypothetical protein